MDQRVKDITTHFFRILNKVIEHQKQPVHYAIDEPLYHSEIHTIMAIGDREGLYMSELARLQGVTRGAVSQMVVRLENKGLVQREADPANGLKVRLSLTAKGKKAHTAHELRHQEVDKELLAHVSQISDAEYRTIRDFLTRFEEMVDHHS